MFIKEGIVMSITWRKQSKLWRRSVESLTDSKKGMNPVEPQHFSTTSLLLPFLLQTFANHMSAHKYPYVFWHQSRGFFLYINIPIHILYIQSYWAIFLIFYCHKACCFLGEKSEVWSEKNRKHLKYQQTVSAREWLRHWIQGWHTCWCHRHNFQKN